jgi:CBS domain-containing protein
MRTGARPTSPERLVTEALAEMEKPPPISEMPVLDAERKLVGVLNLKDIVKAGIV